LTQVGNRGKEGLIYGKKKHFLAGPRKGKDLSPEAGNHGRALLHGGGRGGIYAEAGIASAANVRKGAGWPSEMQGRKKTPDRKGGGGGRRDAIVFDLVGNTSYAEKREHLSKRKEKKLLPGTRGIGLKTSSD